MSHDNLIGMANIAKTKRKCPEESAIQQCYKRYSAISTSSTQYSTRVLELLREYGLLASIVSNLCADDLLALALTSRALHNAVMPRRVSLENLLGRLRCSGKGVAIRNQCHQKSKYFYDGYDFSINDSTEYVQCGSITPQRRVVTRPCVTCKVATCDECRVHCVYQTIYEPPEDGADLADFCGFVMLKPDQQSMLSPQHMNDEPLDSGRGWQDPSTSDAGPYHDQGYLDAPLDSTYYDPPVKITDVLDLNLGQHSLADLCLGSGYSQPGPVLSSLDDVCESRKLKVCDDCYQHKAPRGPAAMTSDLGPMPDLPWLSRGEGSSHIAQCQCTLRERFLNRWLCLRCYQNEEHTIEICTSQESGNNTGNYHCEQPYRHTLCLWCWGEITDKR